MFLEQGEIGEAKLHYQRALQIREKALGTDHPSVARSLNNLGVVSSGQGEHEEAKLHYQQALKIWEEALGADHPDVAHALTGLGEALLALGKPADALAPLERALSIRTTREGGPAELACTRFALALALWTAPAAQGRDRLRARTLAEQARDGYAAAGYARKSELAEVEAWLAEHRLP
jgi:tetratricopeptide (TPR) repeat protein